MALNDVDQAAYEKIQKKMDFIANVNLIGFGFLVLLVILYFVARHYGLEHFKHIILVINNFMSLGFMTMLFRIMYLKGKRDKILERVYGKIMY